jgi:hypothetical protein
MQLHHQLAGVDEALVIRPAMCAGAIEQPLIPPTARFNIPHAYQWLWSHLVSSPLVAADPWRPLASKLQPFAGPVWIPSSLPGGRFRSWPAIPHPHPKRA